MLVWSAFLSLLLPLVYLAGRAAAPGGVAWGFGDRDTPLPASPWTERAVRTHANLVENLAPSAVLVLVAHVSGKANAATAQRATIFFWGRVAHAAIYVAGIPYARTAAFFVATVGELLILAQLLG
jgi:uncharacterized MAPEG superfamily protein